MTKRLMRSRNNKMIAGVCAGIADYFNMDPSVIRLAAVGLVLFTHIFFAIPAYLLMWVIVPQAPSNDRRY